MAKRKNKPIDDNSSKPWVSNYPPLKDWLDKHEARCMWQLPSSPQPSGDDYEINWSPRAYIECWMVNRQLIIIVVHADKHGWEIYSALNYNIIASTLADVERRVGITTEHGVSGDPMNMVRTLAATIIERTHSETDCNTPEDAEALAKLVLKVLL